MTTPNRPDEHDRSEGPVQHLLWRLRARLVAPPREQQAEADLSRLLETARDHAHGGPSSYATANPGPDASSRRPEFALTATAGDELSARRAGRVASATFGRAAAASVAALVLGVGVSHAAGGPVTFDSFFGRDDQVIADGTDPLVAAPVTDGSGDGQVDASSEADVEVEDLDAAEPGAPEADPGASDADAQAEPAEDDVVQDTDPGVTTPAPTAPVEDLPDEAEGTREDVADGEEFGEILAGPADPPSDGLDGFGGGQECEGDDLASCIPADEDEGGPTVGEGDADTEAEDLASRRFRPDDEDEDDQ